ncbi:DegV family protein [Syntrophomonas palmitatica]|uniref:DegV family protein n=1 Tax=Syntrophomonas palmitatica TaxID=402877 RepID=UPI0006D21A0C|nr:DegV family protein [Syntrophomonas palmitatica]
MARLLITDSTSYLTQDIINQYNIKVVPLNVHLENNTYREGLDISNDDYYRIFQNCQQFPRTSQPSSGEFYQVLSEMSSQDEAFVILISSDLSGTVQSASAARIMLPPPVQEKVHIIDSRFSAAALAFQVIRAAEMINDARSSPEIIAELQNMQNRQAIHFIVDDLEYLVKGGRLSKTSGLLGNLLQVKPILHVKEGKVELYTKVRSSHKALRLMIDEVEKNRNRIDKLGVIHVQALDSAQAFKAELEARFDFPIIMSEAGPVIGSHVGPGTIGLAIS